ncbi:sphingosine kinase 2-like isoform X3 [Amblyomma americanum]
MNVASAMPQWVLKDTFRLYPNPEDDYEVTLFENCLVFEPRVKGKGLLPYRQRTEVKLDDVIGCHVMRVGERASGLKKTVSYFCVYAYHLVQKRKNCGHRRQKRTYVFAVDKADDYEANLAVSRHWQSAFLWLLRGVKLDRAGGGFRNLQQAGTEDSGVPSWLRNNGIARREKGDGGVFRPFTLTPDKRKKFSWRREFRLEDWLTSSAETSAPRSRRTLMLDSSSCSHQVSTAAEPASTPATAESATFRVERLLEPPTNDRTAVTTELPIAADSPVLWPRASRDGSIDCLEYGAAMVPQELPAQRHYLVIVNPKSGPGRSLEIFLHRVRPILAEADISHLLLVTERQNHARDFIKGLNLKQWSGILIISGDGLLYEVYNGLMERPDWELAVKIPIGIIPGGSGNGLARTISHAAGEPYVNDPILASTLGIAKGRVAPLDLMKVETPAGPLYSFLTVGWGIMADIDIESEKLRAIGEIRFTLWAFWRVFNLRTYHGRISYLPATDRLGKNSNGMIPRLVPTPRNGTSSGAPPPRHQSSGVDLTGLCSTQNGSTRLLQRSESAPEGHTGEYVTPPEGANGGSFEHATVCAVPGPADQVTGEELPPELELVADSTVERAPGPKQQEPVLSPPDGFPALTDPVPDDWTVEEGRFIICYSSMVSHLGTNLFIAPESRLDDGIAWLLLIRGDASRIQVLSYFKAQEAGEHVDLPFVRLIPVRAFRLETFTDSTITVDGEVVKTKILQARVLPSLGRILTF